MKPVVFIGVGCRRGCDAGSVEAVIRLALRGVPDAVPAGLFTIADKRGEPGLEEAASRLDLDLAFLPREALRDQACAVQTVSPASRSRFGVPGVAESAALAGAGRGAVLLVPRISRDGATCAIAGAAGRGA